MSDTEKRCQVCGKYACNKRSCYESPPVASEEANSMKRGEAEKSSPEIVASDEVYTKPSIINDEEAAKKWVHDNGVGMRCECLHPDLGPEDAFLSGIAHEREKVRGLIEALDDASDCIAGSIRAQYELMGKEYLATEAIDNNSMLKHIDDLLAAYREGK